MIAQRLGSGEILRETMNRLYDFVRRFPLPIIIAFAILMVVANRVHSQRAHYDFTFQTMAPKGTPEFAVFDEFVELFGEDNDVFLIAFTADPLVTNKNLALIDRITRRIEALDSTSTVSSLTNVRDIRGSEDGLDVTEFLEPTPLSAGALRSAREALTTDPIVAGGLISSDGRTTAILGRMREWSNDPRTRVNYFEKIDAILAEEGRVSWRR